MLRVLLVAVEPSVSDYLHVESGPDLVFEDMSDELEVLEGLQRRTAELDALVVGAEVAEPVSLAQRVRFIDRDLGVVILSDPERHGKMASAVQKAPFLGNTVSCLPTGDPAALGAGIEDVVLETSRRRAYRALAARSRERIRNSAPTLSPLPDEEVLYLEHLLDFTPIGVLALGPDGKILASNRFAQKVLGRSERELVGARLAGFFSTGDGRRLDSVIARCSTETPRPPAQLLTLVERSQTPRVLEITATSISERLGRPGIMVVMQDVTDRESARTIRELNAELEHRIAELDAANRELDAFAYSVSHDLRAPLRAINGFSCALLTDHREQLDAAARHALERVHAEAGRMSRLIDDLLDLSRLNRAPVHRESIDLGELVLGVVAELRRRDPGRQVEVDVGRDLTAMADGRLMTIALENLLQNAWKFTAKRPDATIAFGCEQTGEDMAFFVRDNGAGFDMKYQARLFAPFQRLHRSSDFEGSGIGLATVHRIIKRHGGRIWAHAAAGEGATFFFTLGPPGEPRSRSSRECPGGFGEGSGR